MRFSFRYQRNLLQETEERDETQHIDGADESDARGAIVLSLFVLYGLSLILALSAVLHQVVGPLGWSSVLIYLLLTAGFGYFQFRKPAS